MTALIFIITGIAAALFGAITLTGAWIDGRRQKLRNRGLHPTTTHDGNVVAQESQPPLRLGKP